MQNKSLHSIRASLASTPHRVAPITHELNDSTLTTASPQHQSSTSPQPSSIMGLFKLVALAFAATASAQLSSISLSAPSVSLPVFLPPSGTNLPPLRSLTSTSIANPSEVSVSAPLFSSTPVVSTSVPQTPPGSFLTIQTINITDPTPSVSVTTIVSTVSEVSSLGAISSSQGLPTITQTTTLGSSSMSHSMTGTSSSSPPAKSTGAAVQEKMGKAGIVLAMLLGAVGV